MFYQGPGGRRIAGMSEHHEIARRTTHQREMGRAIPAAFHRRHGGVLRESAADDTSIDPVIFPHLVPPAAFRDRYDD